MDQVIMMRYDESNPTWQADGKFVIEAPCLSITGTYTKLRSKKR